MKSSQCCKCNHFIFFIPLDEYCSGADKIPEQGNNYGSLFQSGGFREDRLTRILTHLIIT